MLFSRVTDLYSQAVLWIFVRAAATLPKAWESWNEVNLLGAPGENSYPITSFSYAVVHPELNKSVKDIETAIETVNLLAWMVSEGQKYSPELLYVPVAVPVVNLGLEGLSKVTFDGQKVYTGITSIGEAELEIELPVKSAAAQKIPPWVKNIFTFYASDQITDDDVINAIQFLVNEGLIKLK